MTQIIMYRNLANNETYRVVKGGQVEIKCRLTNTWFPSHMTKDQLYREAVSYTIRQETNKGRWLRKLFSTMPRFCAARGRG